MDDFTGYGVHVYTSDERFPELTPLEDIGKEIVSAGGMFCLDYWNG